MARDPHNHEMANLRQVEVDTGPGSRFAEGQRITWISVGVNIVLTAMQIAVGLIAHSQSLIADAMHTLSDIVADAFVLVANRKGAEAADADHPYGHGRYETAASLVLGLLLAGTGAGILITAASRLQDLGSAPPVGVAAMWAALITLAAKEGLFRYMLVTAERLRSPMLVANAWHARADALSSLVVAAGIGGALLGFNFADAVAAIIVGAMIVKAGLKFTWDAIRELIDTGLSAEEVAAIRRTIAATPGVLSMHELRTRRMAHQVLVDAHVQVNPRISVSEGHRIAETARRRVLASHPEVLDVLVHVDAENDLMGNAAAGLPDRETLLDHLRQLLDANPPGFETHDLALPWQPCRSRNIPAPGLRRCRAPGIAAPTPDGPAGGRPVVQCHTTESDHCTAVVHTQALPH
jgi:cation diffusion facilitator family transporter